MNSYYLNYKYNKNIISNLDNKYLARTSIDDNLMFLYVNLFEIVKTYKYYHVFNQYRDLYNLFINNPFILIENLINYIKAHDYNKKDILFLYSISNYFILNSNSIYSNITLKKDIKELFKDKEEKNYNKVFNKINYIDLYTRDTFENIINKSYDFYKSDVYLNKSLKIFNKLINKNIFFRIKNKLFKLKLYTKRNKNADTELDTIELSNNLLESINKYLYYNEPIEFNKLKDEYNKAKGNTLE